MKALHLTGYGDPAEVVRLVEVPDVAPAGPGEVIIDVEATPVQPTDLLMIEGTYGYLPPIPHILGAEAVGRVAAVGPGVTHLAEGDRTLIPPFTPAWLSRTKADAMWLRPLPDGDIDRLSMLGMNPLTAYLLVTEFVPLNRGDWLLQNAANSSVGRAVIPKATKIDLLIAATAAFALIFLVMLLVTRAIIAALVIVGTVAFSFSGAFGMSVLIWQNLLRIPLSWWNIVFCFILLVAVGSDYNLLLVARYLHESEADLNTGLIRAVTRSGRVVTTAGVVFAVTMMAMVSSDLTSVGIFGSTVGIGLLLDTLIVRSLITPALARLLGPFFWWPRLIPQRLARKGSGAVAPEHHHEDDLYRKVL